MNIIFEEKVSGATKEREQLQKMLEEFCSGLNSYQVSFSTRERVSVMDTQCD